MKLGRSINGVLPFGKKEEACVHRDPDQQRPVPRPSRQRTAAARRSGKATACCSSDKRRGSKDRTRSISAEAIQGSFRRKFRQRFRARRLQVDILVGQQIDVDAVRCDAQLQRTFAGRDRRIPEGASLVVGGQDRDFVLPAFGGFDRL